MEISRATAVLPNQKPQTGTVLFADEKKRLVDFFAILIDIDQRIKRKEALNNEKSDK